MIEPGPPEAAPERGGGAGSRIAGASLGKSASICAALRLDHVRGAIRFAFPA